MSTGVCGQLIFSKVAKTIQWEKQSFQHTVLEQRHRRKNRVRPSYHTPHTDVHSKWIKDLNGRAETVKLKKSHGGKSSDLRLGSGFLYMIQTTKEKHRSTVLHQNLKLLCFKTYIKKMKREPTEWEKRYLPIIYLIRDLGLEDIKCICIYV